VAHLEREREFFAGTATALRSLAIAKDRGDYGTSAQVRALRVTAEAGIRMYEALASWAEWAEQAQVSGES
jgi:hypothetical protein